MAISLPFGHISQGMFLKVYMCYNEKTIAFVVALLYLKGKDNNIMTYYCDGYTLGANPSVKGGGYTITDLNGTVVWQEERLKAGFTNNEGELLGIFYAAMLASRDDVIITDSKIAMAWVRSGSSKVRPDLNKKISVASKLVKFKNLAVIWKPREANLAGHYNEQQQKDKWVNVYK